MLFGDVSVNGGQSCSGESNYMGHRGTENWDLNISFFRGIGSSCCSVPRILTLAKVTEELQVVGWCFWLGSDELGR